MTAAATDHDRLSRLPGPGQKSATASGLASSGAPQTGPRQARLACSLARQGQAVAVVSSTRGIRDGHRRLEEAEQWPGCGSELFGDDHRRRRQPGRRRWDT